MGKGCVFYFTIKFINKNNKEKLKELDNLKQQFSDPIKVLLIEDNKINQLVTKKTLMKLNCNVEIVENGFDALNILESNTFDLILTDINLPEISGFETTKKIRENKIFTPVFAITAYSKEEIQQQAIESGIDAIFVKPFKIGELSLKINEIVNKKTGN